MIVTVWFSLPPKELSPNARVHWRSKMKAARNYRAEACYATRDALKGRRPLATAARMRIRAYHKARRVRDDDNLIASLKAARDGMTDAGMWINDAAAKVESVEFLIDRLRPRIEIDVEFEDTEAAGGGEER